MKTIVFVIAVSCVACALAQAPAQSQTQTVYTYGMPEHRLTVRNTAPWECSILALSPIGKLGRSAQIVTVADLAPGESVFAGEKRRKGGLFNPFSKPSLIGYDRSSDLNIPIVALYFTKEKESDARRYIGAANGIIYVPGAGNTSTSDLVFGQENIRFADDVPTSAPKATPKFAETGAEIPYFGTDGTSIQMFVWNSRTPAHITVNGSASDELRLGNVKALVGRSPIVVTISAIGPDGNVRTWSQGFQNDQFFGTYAQVFILGMSDLH